MMSEVEHVWFCLNCGEPQDVTYEERCVECGSIVKAIPKTSFAVIEAVLAGKYRRVSSRLLGESFRVYEIAVPMFEATYKPKGGDEG